MTRLIRGSVLLAACVGLWSCTDDVTVGDPGAPSQIVATPAVVFVDQGAAQLIGFELVDDNNGQIPSTWTISSPSPNFSITLDSTFRPVYNSDGSLTLPTEQTEVRATISGLALGISEFTVSAGGKSLVIPVNVVPSKLAATFSPASPAPGEVVTMTMPPTLRLNDSSKVTFPGNLAPVSLTIAPDYASATFIPAPTTDAPATVTLVSNLEFPTLPPVTLSTYDTLTGTQAATYTGSLPGTLSPLVAGELTVTLDPAWAFSNSAPVSTFVFTGQTAPILNSISADSTVAVLSIGPNVAAPLIVSNLFFKGAPQFRYSLGSADSVISAVVSEMPVTYSTLTPAFQQDVVISGASGFTFSPTAQAVLGGLNLPVVARAVDGTSITVRNLPGGPGGGTPTIQGAVSPSAPAFALTLPADNAITSLGQMVLAAPGNTLVVPDTGVMQSATFGYPSRVYTTTLASPQIVEVTVTWAGNFDLGLYILDAGGNIVGAADSFGSTGGGGGNGQPELSGPVALPAGTYTFAMLRFGASPANYTMSILTQ